MRPVSLLFVVTVALFHKSHGLEVIEGGQAPYIAACPRDAHVCADGTVLSRDWRNRCQFPECPPLKDCPQDDIMTCPDGKTLKREPRIGCEFPPCELKCCDPTTMPLFFEGGKCCGTTGEWVASTGDGKTFSCSGFTTSGPDYPPPFGKPCPLDCGAMRNKDQCRNQAENGCRWVSKKCVHENDMDCPDLPKRNFCKRFGKCKWRKNKCIPKCGPPDHGKAPCTEEYQPVMCKGCKYDNLCFARSAGQKKKRCQRMCRSNGECSENEVCFRGSKSCKGRDCTGVCTKKTGDTCDGFSGTTCPLGQRCVPTPCPPGVMDSCGGHCVDDGCRNPSSKNSCTDEFNPVLCGDGCKYKNQCLASNAGYKEDQCEGFCPAPNPLLLCGPARYPPLVCGDGKCEYSSECHARQAGFSEEQCKPDCRFAPCPTIYCPNPIYKEGECCPRCDFSKPDCSLVDCALPVCPQGQKPVVPPGECCPQCPKIQPSNCYLRACAFPVCAEGQTPVVPPGECCPKCPTDCNEEFCQVPKCPHGHKAVKKPGKCCPECVLDPCDKPDCRLVKCAQPLCAKDEEPYTPDGHCCGTKCVKKVYCRARCANPNCAKDEEAVRVPGQCCPVCKKICVRK